jgi:hypothetical protein
MSQIVGYVTAEEAQSFAAYAETLGVDASALANLLIRREMQLGRLGLLPAPPVEKRGVKITAHFKDEAVKSKFTDHAGRHGLAAGSAATRLYRAELEELWLLSCLAVNHFDST